MSLCVVCSSLASVFCTQDKAFLCSGCDRSIHSANVLSRRHHRLPVCELCKRNGATVYCHEDAAALCSVCDSEVHQANPLPHTTIHIDAALAQGLAKVTELPSESGCCAHSGGGGGGGAAAATRPASLSQQLQPQLPAAPASLAMMAPQQPLQPQQQPQQAANPFLSQQQQPLPQQHEPLAHHAAADDEVSACGEHNAVGGGGGGHQKRQTDAGASAHHSPSEGNTSLAVVPDMGAQGGGAASAFPTMGLPSQDAINAKAPWATAFDALDFESAWFGNLDGGFDLSDLLGNDMAGLIDDAPGMVPSFPAATAAPSSAAGNSNAAQHQLLVPTAAPSSGTNGMFDMGGALGGGANALATTGNANAAAGAVPTLSQQPQPSDSQALPPNLLLDDDFVVPSFLPEEDAGAALHDPSASAAAHHHAFGGSAHQHRGVSGSQLPLPAMGGEEEEGDEGDAEHQAARAVAVPSFDAHQHHAAGGASAYGTRGNAGGGNSSNKRGAAVSVEELQRGSQQPQGRAAGGASTRKGSSVPPPPPMSGAALLALNGANLTREQRVARYREKRKNRKFHKTIRYASRKAYAEVRPRIKGRFATKEEVEAWKAKKAAGEAIAPEDELIF